MMYYVKEAMMMGVPADVRAVDRPVNTIVQKTAKEGVYIVRGRKGWKEGMPVNGRTVGHIVGLTFVASEGKQIRSRPLSSREVTYKRYGIEALCERCGEGLLSSLRAEYAEKDADSIYACAAVRACYGDVKDYQIGDRYLKSFLSVLHAGLGLSKSSVCRLISEIGSDYKGMHDFMAARIKDMVTESTRVVIDGMLKQDSSEVNSLSGFSFKGRIKGIPDISIMMAMDPLTREPICLKVYKGNLPDFKNYPDFIAEFGLDKGLLIGDKGFDFDGGKAPFSGGKVGFLRPLKRSSKKAEELGLYEGMRPLEGTNGQIMCKEAECDGAHFYAFRDCARAAKEEADYRARQSKAGEWEQVNYEKRIRKSGTIVFVSNVKLTPKTVYEYYRLRWTIELVFRSYKCIESLTDTREHSDESVLGSEFINFLSTILTVRMQNEVAKNPALLKMTYKEVADSLSSVIKTSADGRRWTLCTMNKKDSSILSSLGL